MKILHLLTAPWRWFTRHFVKLTVLVMVLLATYLIYLDAQIQPRFEGNKWQVPAQIYARPLVIETKQEITPQEIIDELELLGYRGENQASQVGEFSVTQNTITVYRRAFYYPDNHYPQQRMRITWKGTRIANIKVLDNNNTLSRTSLEPWLVSRLVSGSNEDRMLVEGDAIPELLVNGLVIVEDKNFYSHHGVAPLAIVRALMANITAGRTVQGGSTLTQQLVKNLFLTRQQTYIRKLREAAMAIVIDARYSKREILDAYINEVFLGQNGATAIHGFGLASHFYFNKPLHELEISETATLIGLVKGPSYYDPNRRPKRMTERRNLVLRLMFEANEINRSEYEVAINSPLVTIKNSSLASGKHPAFMDKVRNELKEVVNNTQQLSAGVKVFTTLDINAQRRAEKAVKQVVAAKSKAYKQADLEAALVMTDIKSGGIRAMIGGKNTEYAGFNRALNAYRPIGSLIKPVVYLRALEQPERFNLASTLQDQPISYDDAEGKKWRPLNADKKFRGQVMLIEGLVNSYNVPSVNLAASIGFDEVVNTLNRLGANKQVAPLPSIALGAVELSPLQVNQVYQTISNEGVLRPLFSLYAVSTHNNTLIWKREERSQQRADEDATYLLNYALHKVTLEGTGKRIKATFPNVNMAGKTGTTDDYRDSWFSGFDRNLVTSIWLGNDNNKPINMSGASGAMAVFIALQQHQSPKTLVRKFPASLNIAHFNQQTGERTLPGCPNVVSLPAIRDTLPAATPCSAQPKAITQPQKTEKSWWQKLFGT